MTSAMVYRLASTGWVGRRHASYECRQSAGLLLPTRLRPGAVLNRASFGRPQRCCCFSVHQSGAALSRRPTGQTANRNGIPLKRRRLGAVLNQQRVRFSRLKSRELRSTGSILPGGDGITLSSRSTTVPHLGKTIKQLDYITKSGENGEG